MSSSLLLSRLPGPATAAGGHSRDSIGHQKSSFLTNPKLIFAPPRAKKGVRGGCSYRSPVASMSFDHIPKQFREENLKEGLMQNFKNVPSSLYGLTPSQMDMFMTEDSPMNRLSSSVTEESLSANYSYINNGGMRSLSGVSGPEKYRMTVNMYRGGARGYARRGRSPPDLPSLLLDSRIVYLGMPIVPAVCELIVAELMWLEYDDNTKPIYIYIFSPGTQNEDTRELLGSEGDAYAIADCIGYCRSDVYTVNLGMAYGQAAMLLALGKKGFRALQPHSLTQLYLPSTYKSSGPSTDMWIKGKELEVNTEYYLELLSKGIGKPKEEIERDIRRPRYFNPQEAIDYGIADRIYDKDATSEQKSRNYDELMAQSRAMRRQAGPGAQAADGSGFRKP